VPGEHPQGEERSEQNPIGKSPLKNHLWNLIEEVEKDKMDRGFVFDELTYPLEEKYNDIDEEQAAQAQTEDIEIFPYDVSMEDAVIFKHLQKNLSISVS
jgi:hypothetical protein